MYLSLTLGLGTTIARYMMNIAFFFQFASLLLAVLAISILIWVNREVVHSKKLLILLLLSVTAMNLNGVAYHTGWYLGHPAFHKLLYPFAMFIAPLSYLYIRSVFLHEYRFKKKDYLLFIPAILVALSLIPYFIMPEYEKSKFVEQYYQQHQLRAESGNGIIPPFIFPFLRFVWSLIFILLNFRLISTFKRKTSTEILSNNVSILGWIQSLNFTLTLLLFSTLVSAILAVIVSNDYYMPDVAMGILGLLISMTLFAKPEILYGIYQPSKVVDSISQRQPVIVPEDQNTVSPDNEGITGPVLERKDARISTGDAFNLRLQIEHYFQQHRPYLQPDYSLDKMVEDLKTPRYMLSAFINREYRMGFREFLNRHRIQYLLDHLHQTKWQQFTLEGIANECGFSNRTTFINHFKEVTGMTPTAYLHERKSGKKE
jgi:AraC-like DNA-binding protein